MSRPLISYLKKHRKITDPVLSVLSLVSGYFTYQGAASLFATAGSSFVNSASAGVFSIGVTAGIYLFWHMAMGIAPAMPTVRSRVLAMAITALGWPFLIALSSWLNVTAMAGNAALELHMTKSVPAFELALEDAGRHARLAERLVPDLKAAADRYAGLAAAERSSGRITGVAGNGGIADTLEGVSRQLGGLVSQVGDAGKQVDAAAADGRKSLEKMRAISVSKEPLDRRMQDFAVEADGIKALIVRMEGKGLAESIGRSAAALSDTVIERVSSRNAQVASAQAEALARIREDLARTGASIAEVAAQIAAQPAIRAPDFDRISVVRAVVKYAGSFVPFWAGGIALDLLPTLLILYLMLAHAVAGPDVEEDDDDRECGATGDRYDHRTARPQDGDFAESRLARGMAMFGRMSPKGFAMIAAAAIIALMAIDMVSASLPSWKTPELGELLGSGRKPRSSLGHADHCLVMPDGVRVCEPAFKASGGAEAHGFFDPQPLPNTLKVREPSPAAVEAVRRVADAIGLEPNFKLVEADFDEDQWAYAMIREGKRLIVYDRKRFHWDSEPARWEDVTILAHEIGHHLNGHTLASERSAWAIELKADQFAGFAISRLGGSLVQAQSVYRHASEAGSKTHPPRAQRLAAIEAGWRHSEALKNQEPLTCATDWLGEAFAVRNRSCRMAKVCGDDGLAFRLACEERHGEWLWQR